MKYLRAVISSEARGILYKKDFQVKHVFGPFVRSFVSSLVTADVVKQGESYRALIIPRYGQFRRMPPQVETHRPVQEGELQDWIALAFEGAVNPKSAIDFFTVDLFIAEQLRSFRSNFKLWQIDYFWRGIDRALEQVSVLLYQDTVVRKLYARDDDEGDFEHEEVQALQADTPALFEIMPVERSVPVFQAKALSDFAIQTIKKLRNGSLVDETPDPAAADVTMPASSVYIVISQSALESLQQIARSGLQVEQGGALVGDVYVNAASNNRAYIVEIIAHIAAEKTFASEVELRYTFESWQRQTSLLKENFSGKRIVGWYHTHLDLVKQTYYTDDTRQDTYTTPLFFSQDDAFTHRQFFHEKWYIAMVLDPRGDLAFYQWEGEKIMEAERFYVSIAEAGG